MKVAATVAVVFFLSCKENQNSSQSSSVDSTTTVSDTAKSASVYTCPMHPEVLSDQPGQCPTCGMDLEPKV